jgi:NADH-quinone oxidoreductase subunit C
MMINLLQLFVAKQQSLLLTVKGDTYGLLFPTVTFTIKPKSNLTALYHIFKNLSLAFIDATVIDNLDKINRFSLVYTFLSLQNTTQLFLKIPLYFAYPIIPTASTDFFAAVAVEREIYDMYGVFFKNHIDLRRILTDYSFKGHPLKRDFPLSGYSDLRYSIIKKTLIFSPLVLSQEFRAFHFDNPFVEHLTRAQ